MIRSVIESDLDIDHGVASHHPGLQCLFHALLNRRNILFRDDAAHNLVDKLESRSGSSGLDLEPDMSVLSTSAGLPYIPALRLCRGRHGFTIGNLRFPDIRLDPKLPHEPVDNDLEVQFSHPRDDGLNGLLV